MNAASEVVKFRRLPGGDAGHLADHLAFGAALRAMGCTVRLAAALRYALVGPRFGGATRGGSGRGAQRRMESCAHARTQDQMCVVVYTSAQKLQKDLGRSAPRCLVSGGALAEEARRRDGCHKRAASQ